MSLDSLYRNLLFAYDCDTTVVAGGVTWLKDFGPLGLHLPLTGAGAPNPPTRYIDGSYTWDGTNDQLTFPADCATRFWNALPDGWTDFCFIFKGFYRAPAAGDVIFDAINAATTAGFQFKHRTASAERLQVAAYTAAGSCNCGDGTDIPLTGRTRVSIHAVRYNAGVSPTIYWRQYDGGMQSATAYIALTGVPLAWDRTVAPKIGERVGGAARFDGRMYYLAVLKCLPTPDEVSEISQLFEGQRKPWCRLP